MKNILLFLAIFAVCSACKTKKKVVAAQQSLADTVYVENPKTGEIEMMITTKNMLPEGDWILQTIEGNSDDEMSRVSMQINANEKRVSGNDACNQYSGKLTTLNDRQIEFGPMASTKRACMVPAKYAKQFYQTLEKVTTYTTTGKYLLFKDAENKNLMQFVKKETNE